MGWGLVVRMEGVEPTCLAALDPKSSASASFATSAGNVSWCSSKLKLVCVKLF